MRNLVPALSLLVALIAALTPHTASAQSASAKEYPSRPIRFLVPFVAGIGTDLIARAIAAKLSEKWGQQVVVDNRPGAAGSIGVDLTLQAPPNGHTICLISASHAVNSATHPTLSYDLLRDVQGVTQATSLNYVLYVHPGVPAKNIQEFVAHAKAHPNKLNFGSSGTGGLQHLAGELLKRNAGIQLVHIPYKGGAQVNAEVMAGNIQVGFGTLSSRRLYQIGKLRPLGLSARKRSSVAPDMPTIAEQGVAGYEVDQWYGVATSAKVPIAITAKLSQAITEAVKAPDIAERWAADGTQPVGSTHEEFQRHIRAEVDKWARFVKETGLALHR